MALLVQGVRSVLNRSACLIKNVAPRAVCVYSQQQRLHSRMTAAPSFNILLQVRFFLFFKEKYLLMILINCDLYLH